MILMVKVPGLTASVEIEADEFSVVDTNDLIVLKGGKTVGRFREWSYAVQAPEGVKGNVRPATRP